MAHSKNKVWIHGVFSTKYRKSLITKNIQVQIWEMLSTNLRKVGCYPEIVGGVEDHVHVLFLLNRDTTLSKAFQQMKGATTRAINKMNLIGEYFSWQVGYAAFSVSESKVPVVIRYIQNQEEHHKRKNFQQELKFLIEGHGMIYEPQDLD